MKAAEITGVSQEPQWKDFTPNHYLLFGCLRALTTPTLHKTAIQATTSTYHKPLTLMQKKTESEQ